MNNLTQIQELFSGLLNIYIYKSESVIFGDIIEGVIQSITLKPGYDYIKIPFTQNTAGFDNNARVNKIAYNDNAIELFLPGNNLDQIQDITETDGKKYIILFEDRQNNTFCLGTPEVPLRISDKYSTGKSSSESNGRKITFENQSRLSILSLSDSVYDPILLAEDWFLPSSDEMLLVFTELIAKGIGNFMYQGYITSTELDETYCRWVSVLGNLMLGLKTSDYALCVVRAFTSEISYVVGDFGEAGWIFYKDGNNYLEARSVHEEWVPGITFGANGIDVGASGTAIGTGQSNTNKIIAADATEGIAARLADDFILYSS